MKVIYLEVSDKTHSDLKVYCAKNGITIKSLINKLLFDILYRHK